VAGAIQERGGVVVASLPANGTGGVLRQLQSELLKRVSQGRILGVVLDVSAVEIMDSFSARTLRTVAAAVRLCGSRAVVSGIQPEVAFAMTQLGVDLAGIATALDLDDAVAELEASAGEPHG
jgi:rsbT antagonist protein RsbS